jgi:hypothetical protein
MALGDLFKSKKERENAEKSKRRKAFREAENAVDTVRDRVTKLKRERDKAWTEARAYLKDGQKAAAQRSLQTCRAAEMMGAKLEMKRWVFEQLLTKLDLAKTDQEFTQSMAAINTVVKIDPEAVADVMGEVEDKLGDQVDTDKIWEKMYGKEMDGVENQMTDLVPSMEDMMGQLQDEVAEDISADRPAKSKAKDSNAPERRSRKETDGSLDSQISDARKRIRDGLEGEK